MVDAADAPALVDPTFQCELPAGLTSRPASAFCSAVNFRRFLDAT